MRTAVLAASAALTLAVGTVAAVEPSASADGPHRCTNHVLKVSHSHTNGATGHANVIIRFRNIGSSSCTLHGYPGLDAVRANGTVLAHAKRTRVGFTGGAKHVRTITVRPGHYASADVEWTDFNPKTSGACAFSHSIATTPANTARASHFRVSVSRCRLQVHPTVAGRSGNG